MKEVILNRYVRVEPVENTGFIASDHFEEIGVVISKDESIADIPIGAKVYFDSYMAKKYPTEGDATKFQWFVPFDEIVKYEYEEV